MCVVCVRAPVCVSGEAASAISLGGDHTCALLVGGGVACWGYNGHGQLGNGGTVNATSPSTVSLGVLERERK